MRDTPATPRHAQTLARADGLTDGGFFGESEKKDRPFRLKKPRFSPLSDFLRSGLVSRGDGGTEVVYRRSRSASS